MALACASHVRRLLLHPGARAPARSFYAQPHQATLVFLLLRKIRGAFLPFVVVSGAEFLRAAKVDVVEFLNGVSKGVETQAVKLEEAVGGDLQRVPETRTPRHKKLGGLCKLDMVAIETSA